MVALFTFGFTMDDSDAIPIGVAFVCVGTLLLRSRTVPSPVAWLTLITAVPQFISTPADIAGFGFVGFISVLLSIVWAFIVGVPLLVKPDWGSGQRLADDSDTVRARSARADASS